MKVKELLADLSGEYRIGFETYSDDHGTLQVCYTMNKWQGIIPYLDRRIITWSIAEDLKSNMAQLNIVLCEQDDRAIPGENDDEGNVGT